MATSEVDFDILLDLEGSCGFVAIAVARNGHEFHFHQNIHLAGQISEEKDGSTEDANNDWVLVLVIVGDLNSELANPLLNLFTGEKNSFDILIHIQVNSERATFQATN